MWASRQHAQRQGRGGASTSEVEQVCPGSEEILARGWETVGAAPLGMASQASRFRCHRYLALGTPKRWPVWAAARAWETGQEPKAVEEGQGRLRLPGVGRL